VKALNRHRIGIDDDQFMIPSATNDGSGFCNKCQPPVNEDGFLCIDTGLDYHGITRLAGLDAFRDGLRARRCCSQMHREPSTE